MPNLELLHVIVHVLQQREQARDQFVASRNLGHLLARSERILPRDALAHLTDVG